MWPDNGRSGSTGRYLNADPHQRAGPVSHSEGVLRRSLAPMTSPRQVARSAVLANGSSSQLPRAAAAQASPEPQTQNRSYAGQGPPPSSGILDWATSIFSAGNGAQQQGEGMVIGGSASSAVLRPQGGYPIHPMEEGLPAQGPLMPMQGQMPPTQAQLPQTLRRGVPCQPPPPLQTFQQAIEERWPQEVLHHLGMAPQGVGRRPPPSKRAQARAPATSGLRLVAGACQIPHPNKADTGGEDSYFISEDGSAVGVADGVGEWEKLGISTRPLADELMNGAKLAAGHFVNAAAGERAYLSLRQGFSTVSCFGACTANVAALDARGQHIGVANVGDSGLRQIRKVSGPGGSGSMVVNCSRDQQHFFNCPFQLTRRPHECDYPLLLAQGKSRLVETLRSNIKMIEDTPEDADIYTFPLEEGDVLILGSDGLFDNLHDTEICDFINLAITPMEARQVYAEGAGTLRGPGSSTDPGALATTLAHAAFGRALDADATTPFSICARSNGIPHSGGKLDDITVVCAWVVLTAD